MSREIEPQDPALSLPIVTEESAEQFFKRRAEGADKVDFLEILRGVPDREPDPGDELK